MIQRPGGPKSRGAVVFGGRIFRAALGPSGIVARKREGDGATPRGELAIRVVLYRPDRIARPRTPLPTAPIRPGDGWCDASGDRNYNRRVRLPYPASAERLWRDDHLYDLVLVLGWNDAQRLRGRGSAIFMHLARDRYAPTEGCVALSRPDLLRLLRIADGHVRVKIG